MYEETEKQIRWRIYSYLIKFGVCVTQDQLDEYSVEDLLTFESYIPNEPFRSFDRTIAFLETIRNVDLRDMMKGRIKDVLREELCLHIAGRRPSSDRKRHQPKPVQPKQGKKVKAKKHKPKPKQKDETEVKLAKAIKIAKRFRLSIADGI